MEQQQQSFHPSEISLLVLRYLAGIQCTATAQCFYDELPGLKEFLQSKNRGCQSPRVFQGPEVLGSLEDILYDYGKAKMMVKKLIVTLMNEWRVLSEDDISPCDTLGTQLKQVCTLLSNIFTQPKHSAATQTQVSQPSQSTSSSRPHPLQSESDESARPLPPLPDSSVSQPTTFTQANHSHSRNPYYLPCTSSTMTSPELTPVKIAGSSDEHFMDRPPTPSTGRLLMDIDGNCNSWDSTDGKITLHFENNGIYPTNLLQSSPIRDGIPKTPGRMSPTQETENEKNWSDYSDIFETRDLLNFKNYEPNIL